MRFISFSSQDERRKFGGSDFIEFQYCKLKQGAEIKEIVSVETVEHWKDDSLYVFGDDMDEFFAVYSEILSKGTYNNGGFGTVDLLGINYYSSEQTVLIIEKIKKENPKDCMELLRWLEGAGKYNGFYILGV